MRSCKALFGPFLISGLAVICFASLLQGATEESTSTTTTTTTESSATTQSTATTQAPAYTQPTVTSPSNLGGGLYSRLPFQLSISLNGGYDDNVSTTKEAHGSSFMSVGALANYDFGNPRTRLSLKAGANYTHYFDHIPELGVGNNDYDVKFFLGYGLTHNATPRLKLDSNGYISYQTEPDINVTQGLNRRTGGNYFYTNDDIKATYLWTARFSTATSYGIAVIKYDDASIGTFQDRIENTFGNEFRFLVWPTTNAIAEYRFQVISYFDDSTRDSTTHYALGGFDHAFSSRFHLSFRGGAQFRQFDSGGNDSSPYFEGTVDYAAGKQTSVSWSNSYGFEEPDVPQNQSRETFRTALQARHNLTPRIQANLNVGFQHDSYQSVDSGGVTIPGFSENWIDFGISLRYAMTRYFSIEAGYNHVEVQGDDPLREYSRNRYWAGLNVTF